METTTKGPATTVAVVSKKTEFSKLNTKTKLSETQFYKVDKVVGNKVQLVNDYNEYITVDKNYVEKCLTSSDQFNEVKAITKTELANLFITNPSVVMTVNFNKQIKEADVVKEIVAAYEGSTPKGFSDAVKKAVKRGLTGEERTMVGRHYGAVDEFGRIHFTDMEVEKDESKDYDVRHRLVDPRTINFLILRGTKYNVK